jgi:hypothetical protein
MNYRSVLFSTSVILLVLIAIYPANIVKVYCCDKNHVSGVIGDGNSTSALARVLRSGGTVVQGGYAGQSFVQNIDLSDAVSASAPTRLSGDLAPTAPSSYRYVMCHDVDSNNNPSGLTPSFETSDYRACENVVWYTDAGNHALAIKWYYRTGDTSWAYYGEYTESGYLSEGYWAWSCWIYISGYWPASNPRAWKAEFYDNSVLVSKDYCEITPSTNPGDSTMCKDVQGSSPWDPIDRTSTFQRGVDTKACAWFKWDNMYYFYEPDNTCHLVKFEWIDPSSSTVRVATVYFEDYYDKGYSYWLWGKAWDSLPISSSTPLGNWKVNIYMDKFRWDGSFPTWYRGFEGPMFTLTFTVTDAQNHPPVLSNGHVTPTSGYPSTEFTFEVTYTDQDGDNPGDRKHVYIYDNGWSRYDMNYISGTPQSGMIFQYKKSGFSEGDHNYFFHFNDEHGAEAYFPPDGSYLSLHVGPGVGAKIRVDPTSLSFDAYASAGALPHNKPSFAANTFADYMTVKVDFAGLTIENNEDGAHVTSAGCEESAETGSPIFPIKSFLVLLPPNTILQSITITTIDQVKLPGKYDVARAGPPTIAGSHLFLSKNSKVSELYPTETCVASEVGGFKGYRVISVVAFAAQYFSDSKFLFQNNAITIILEFDTSRDESIESMFRGIIEDRNEIEGMVVNPDATSMYSLRSVESTATYKYVIITTTDMVSAFQPLADWKTQKLGSACIVTVSTIESQYAGVDTQEKIRNFLQYAYQNWQTQWVLLGGDIEAVPQRGAYGYVMSNTGPVEDKNIPCDLYYSDLDGTWDADGDHIYGETTDGVNLYPDLYVGRAPVNTAAEATNFGNKVLTYEQSPPSGYLTKALLIAYWLDSSTNEAGLKDYIASNYLSGYTITKYYESSLGSGVDKNGVINSINSGQGIVNQASHGNEWSVPPFDISDVDNLQNDQKYFVFYSMACYTNAFDRSDCIAEHFLLNNHGGAVAYIGNSRYGWYYSGQPGNGPGDQYDKEFFKFLSQGYKHIGETLAKSKVTFIPQSGDNGPFRWIQYCLNLLGDPEMTIHTEEFGKSLRVYNDGDMNLVVSDITKRHQAGEPIGWLDANPKSFIVPVGTTPQEVTVTVNSAGLSPNTYHAWLQIHSNDAYGNTPCEVPVTLTVHPKTYTITFYTNPIVGSITFSGTTYTHGQTGSYADGSYNAMANPPTNYAFHHWEYGGGVYVPNININPTTVQVTGDGWLKAVFSAKITFHTNPSGVGSITYDGKTYTDGQYMWEVNLPPDYGNTRSIQANVPSGYTFDRWGTAGSISVSNTSNPSTTLTVNGPGDLTVYFIDNTPPVVNITYPAEGQYIDTVPIIWINGTVTETNMGSNLPMINDTVAFNLHHFDPTTGEFAFYNITVIPDCTHSYKVNFTDLAGNTGNGTVTFTIDTVYPVVDIICPTDNHYFDSEALIWINGTFTEKNLNLTDPLVINHTGFMLANWTWNPSPPYNGTFAFKNSSALTDGIYHIKVSITDKAAKTGSATATFHVDTVPPIVVIAYPTNGQYLNTATIWINGTVTELNKGSLEPDINNTGFSLISWDPSTGIFAFKNNTVMPDGTVFLTVNFTDLAGKTGYATVTFNLTPPVVNAYLVVRGLDNKIYYRLYNCSSKTWNPWMVLSSGATCDSPAAALCHNELHIVVRGMGGSTLWHGYVDLTDNTFSGWMWLSGWTPSAPTLTSNGTVLSLVVRGGDNRVYYRVYSLSPRGWGSWNVLPSGSTCDSPAAAMLGNDLHIVVRGMDGFSLWHVIVRCDGSVVRGWKRIPGAIASRPALASSQSSNKMYLVVRGLSSIIYYNVYVASTDSWEGFKNLPGATSDGPAATVIDNKLQVVVRGFTSNTPWYGYLDLSTNTFSDWSPLSGATPSSPTLTS